MVFNSRPLRLGADIKSESETLRADLAQHAEEAAKSAAAAAEAAAAAAGASVAAEVGGWLKNKIKTRSLTHELERRPGCKHLKRM